MKTLDFLNKEKENLEQKISRTLENGDIGTYKNLMQAYERVLYLIKEEDVWQEKFSHYHSNGKELISTWEQKGEDIRNNKKYEVKEIIEQKDLFSTYEYHTSKNIDKNNSLKIVINQVEDYVLTNATLDIKISNARHFHTVDNSTCSNPTCLTSYTYTDGRKILIVINGTTAFKLLDDGGVFDISKYISNGENVIEICSVNNSYNVIADVKMKNKLNV